MLYIDYLTVWLFVLEVNILSFNWKSFHWKKINWNVLSVEGTKGCWSVTCLSAVPLQYLLKHTQTASRQQSIIRCISYFLDNCSSDWLHIWQDYCWGNKEVQWQMWSCLGERFSRKLQAAAAAKPDPFWIGSGVFWMSTWTVYAKPTHNNYVKHIYLKYFTSSQNTLFKPQSSTPHKNKQYIPNTIKTGKHNNKYLHK